MNDHSEQLQEGKSQSFLGDSFETEDLQTASSQSSAPPPDAAVQLKRIEMANNSPQVQQLKALQASANNRPSRQAPSQLRSAPPPQTASFGGDAPMQRVSDEDFHSSFGALKDFNFADEYEARDFWSANEDAFIEDDAASGIYMRYASLQELATDKAGLVRMLTILTEQDDVTKDECNAFVALMNGFLPADAQSGTPEFMSLFMGQQVEEDDVNPNLIQAIAKEFIGPLQDLVAMRPDENAALEGAHVIMMITQRIAELAQRAVDGHRESADLMTLLNQCGFVERLMNILVVMETPRRVICHETEIARPLINALASSKASGVKMNTKGLSVPLEEDLAARSMKLFKQQRKDMRKG